MCLAVVYTVVLVVLLLYMYTYRYHLKGPKAGQWDLFLSNLPGIVDNITPSKRIPGFWIAIPSLRPTALLDFSFQWSLLQQIKAKVSTK